MATRRVLGLTRRLRRHITNVPKLRALSSAPLEVLTFFEFYLNRQKPEKKIGGLNFHLRSAILEGLLFSIYAFSPLARSFFLLAGGPYRKVKTSLTDLRAMTVHRRSADCLRLRKFSPLLGKRGWSQAVPFQRSCRRQQT